MRTVLAMAVKDLRLMSRDWLGMFFILAFPDLDGDLLWVDVRLGWRRQRGSCGSPWSMKIESAISQEFVANLKDTGNVEVEALPRDDGARSRTARAARGADRASQGLRRDGWNSLDGEPRD